ncbi:MAG: hypothetical protein RBR44_04870 [Bacilli bacterium]|jgi:hypothetical protein|nr:hypothetical protein [Bacilli bacterium]
MKFVKAMDDLPMIVKFILALPALDIVWVIYRIIKSYAKGNMLGVVLGVVLVIVGLPFLWLIDMIFIVLKGQVFWID